MDNFEATFVSGRSAGTGTTNQTNPQIELKWSDDGGANWGNPRIFAMGKIGEYQKRIRALRLGNTGLKWGRRYELRVTDPHVVALTECRVNEAAV
jgi:hypothetical protein